jgi:hypothetical protein
MIQQSKDKFEFITEDGTTVAIDSGRLVTVMRKEDYDEPMKKKVEVILSWTKKK